MRWWGRRRRADREVQDALRASLLAHARQAPSGEGFPERVFAAVDRPAPSVAPRRRWTGMAGPVIAAASVAAVAAIAVGIANSGGPSPAQAGHGHHRAPIDRLWGRKATMAPTPGTRTTPRNAPPSSAGALHGVRILDLTFAGTDDGWALASANCLSGPGRCTAVLRTHDGTHWRPMPGAAFNVPGVRNCAAPCVDHLRFANDQVGYAFGPSVLFMTTDAGRTWQRQPGGALALETFNGNVIRVTSPHSGCPGPCDIRVETAPVGNAIWQPAKFQPTSGVDVQLARGPADAYLLITANPAGGASNEQSRLFRSSDNGATWTDVGEPCPQRAGEVDSSAVAAGGAGRVAVICTHRSPPQHSFLTTSANAGTHVVATAGRLPWAWSTELTGDPQTVLAVGSSSGLAISRNRGASWQRVASVPGGVTFVGFESAQAGRVVAQHGRSIWTTRDGGRTWTPVTFH